MGNRFNHNLPHRSTTNGIFLPMLCSRSSSTKNVHVITKLPHNRPKDIPSSPKVSCIGQVRNNLCNNKVVSFQTPTYKLTATSSSTKYHKLKRLFSGKNIFTPPATSANSSSIVRGPRVTTSQTQNCRRAPDPITVDVATLDPPLPVVKKADQTPEGENLWKRRSCGTGLRTLQLEKINVARENCSVQPITTV